MIDISLRHEIRQSPWQLLKLIVLGVLMTSLCGALALPWLSGLPLGPFPFNLWPIGIGWIGLLFFGACLSIAIWRALTTLGPVIIIAPQGFRDARVSNAVVPWRAIRSVSTWASNGQEIMVLGLEPGSDRLVPLKLIARLTAGANAALGADGLAIAATGLKIDCDDLIALTTAYARAYNPRFAAQ